MALAHPTPQTVHQPKKAQPLTLRHITQHDNDAINTLIQTIHHEYNLSMDYTNRDTDLKNIVAYYPPVKSGFWVYENESNQIVGTGAIQQKSISTAELKRFYLAKNYRSGGHGQRMMSFLINFCKQRHYERLVLESHTSQEKAIRFYQTYGFTEIPIYSQGIPKTYTNIAFELRLTNQ